jgi:hypothetical protein
MKENDKCHLFERDLGVYYNGSFGIKNLYMAIRIEVLPKHGKNARKSGACNLPDGKTWVIPDGVKDLNPFKRWLPDGEGFYVQQPYALARSRLACYRCKKITPVIALCGRVAQQAFYSNDGCVKWEKAGMPVFFRDVTYLAEEVDKYLQENYPFFKMAYSDILGAPIWGNACIHCEALLDDFDEFRYGQHTLNTVDIEELREIRIAYFDLEFDYFIRAGWYIDPMIAAVLGGYNE